MRYTITGRNIDVTPGLRAAIEEKIGKLERYFLPDTEIIVTLSVQKDKRRSRLPSRLRATLSVPKNPAVICTYPLTWWKRSDRKSVV